jgi:hypothetical protein
MKWKLNNNITGDFYCPKCLNQVKFMYELGGIAFCENCQETIYYDDLLTKVQVRKLKLEKI